MREAKNMGTVTTFEKNLPQKGGVARGSGPGGNPHTRTPANVALTTLPGTRMPQRAQWHKRSSLLIPHVLPLPRHTSRPPTPPAMPASHETRYRMWLGCFLTVIGAVRVLRPAFVRT